MRRLLLLLAACAKPAPPVAINKASPPPPPPPPACVTPPDEAAQITHATADGDRASYCIGTSTEQCFSIEFATGKLARIAAPLAQLPSLDPRARVETTNPELKICQPSGEAECKTLAAQVWPGAASPRAATNGAFAVVLLGDAEKRRGFADVWDVAKAKKVVTFRYAQGDFRCGEVAMLGETIYIGASDCRGPTARGALYSMKGKRIAAVGGKDWGTFGNAFTQVEGTTWAFLEESATKVAVQDVAKGKVVMTVDVSALWRTDGAGEAFGNPGESAIVRAGAGKLAVIAGTPSNGSVALVEIATGDVKVQRAPVCHDRAP